MTPPGYEPKEKNCLKCAHHTTCIIFKFAGRFIDSEFPSAAYSKEERPFQPEQMAKICRFYNPLQRIEPIQG